MTTSVHTIYKSKELTDVSQKKMIISRFRYSLTNPKKPNHR